MHASVAAVFSAAFAKVLVNVCVCVCVCKVNDHALFLLLNTCTFAWPWLRDHDEEEYKEYRHDAMQFLTDHRADMLTNALMFLHFFAAKLQSTTKVRFNDCLQLYLTILLSLSRPVTKQSLPCISFCMLEHQHEVILLLNRTEIPQILGHMNMTSWQLSTPTPTLSTTTHNVAYKHSTVSWQQLYCML